MLYSSGYKKKYDQTHNSSLYCSLELKKIAESPSDGRVSVLPNINLSYAHGDRFLSFSFFPIFSHRFTQKQKTKTSPPPPSPPFIIFLFQCAIAEMEAAGYGYVYVTEASDFTTLSGYWDATTTSEQASAKIITSSSSPSPRSSSSSSLSSVYIFCFSLFPVLYLPVLF